MKTNQILINIFYMEKRKLFSWDNVISLSIVIGSIIDFTLLICN